MKKFILPCLASVALAALSACSHTTVEPTTTAPAPATSTTTTEQPASSTTTTTQTPASTTTTTSP
jgi:hypothetical protein